MSYGERMGLWDKEFIERVNGAMDYLNPRYFINNKEWWPQVDPPFPDQKKWLVDLDNQPFFPSTFSSRCYTGTKEK